MKKDRAVSPIIATLLLLGIVVSITALYTVIATGLIGDSGSEDYNLPNVDTEVNKKSSEISTRLIDRGDMSQVIIRTPTGSSIDNIYLNEPGDKSKFTIGQNDTGTYQMIARNSNGDEVLLENIQIGSSASDNVNDLSLVLVEGSVEGGEDSIEFKLKNTGNEEVSITDFQVEEVNINDITIDTNSPPSRNGRGDNEIFIDSSPSDGTCGKQPPKELPINQIERFENCQAASEPSVAASGATMTVKFNGVDADKATDYIGLSPVEKYTDVRVILYGPKGESVEIPLSLDTFVVPKINSYVYDNQLDSNQFSTDPSTIIVRNDTTVKQEIKNLDSSVYVSKNVTLEDEIENVNALTSADLFTSQDDIDNLEDGVFLGDNSNVSTIIDVKTFRIGSDSSISGEVSNIQEDVEIGSNSQLADEVHTVGGNVTIKQNTVANAQIYDIDGDLVLRDDVTVNAQVSGVSGSVLCGDNVYIQSGSCDGSI
jgi:flagellin-like protein